MSPLRLQVGQKATRSLTVSAEDVERYAQTMGDRNPLHFDERFAASTPFGKLVVQGGITAGILNALVAEDLPGPGPVFLQLDLSFRAPVRPGDTVTGAVEVLEVRDDKPVCRLAVEVRRDAGVTAIDGTALSFTAPT